MEKEHQHRVLIAGIGGRGILTTGRILAEAGMTQYKHVSFFENYGSAVRGGPSECTVILSDNEIRSQSTYYPEEAIVMDISYLKPMELRIKPGGIMVLDSSVIKNKVGRDDIITYYIPATQKALQMGNIQVTNIIIIGAYIGATGAVPMEAIEQKLEERMLGKKGEALLSLNREALKEGAKLVATSKG